MYFETARILASLTTANSEEQAWPCQRPTLGFLKNANSPSKNPNTKTAKLQMQHTIAWYIRYIYLARVPAK